MSSILFFLLSLNSTQLQTPLSTLHTSHSHSPNSTLPHSTTPQLRNLTSTHLPHSLPARTPSHLTFRTASYPLASNSFLTKSTCSAVIRLCPINSLFSFPLAHSLNSTLPNPTLPNSKLPTPNTKLQTPNSQTPHSKLKTSHSATSNFSPNIIKSKANALLFGFHKAYQTTPIYLSRRRRRYSA